MERKNISQRKGLGNAGNINISLSLMFAIKLDKITYIIIIIIIVTQVLIIFLLNFNTA